MSRTRSRLTSTSTPIVDVWNGVVTTNPSSTYSLVEDISDVNNRRSRPPSSCTHSKTQLSRVDRVRQNWMPYGPFSYGERTILTAYHYELWAKKVHDPRVRDWTRKAMLIISNATSVADEFSLLNNIVELDELPKLFLNYKNLANAYKSKGSSGSKLKSTVDNVNYLQWEFGIAPLLADMRTLYNNIVTVRSRIQNLAAGKWQVLSKVEEIPFRHKAVLQNNMTISYLGNTTCSLSGEVLAVIPGLHEAEFQLKVLLDVFGVHLDPAFVWDAIPFTWLFDWFLPLGDYFSSLNTSNRKWVKVDLTGQAYITTKSEGTFSSGVSSPGDPAGYMFRTMSPGEGNFAYYSRQAINFGRSKRAAPLKLVLPDFDSRKLAILASLAQAKRPR